MLGRQFSGWSRELWVANDIYATFPEMRTNVQLGVMHVRCSFIGYLGYPPTYGFAALYNPYTGTFGRGTAVYGPYGDAGGWAAYNSRTGTCARGGAVYGPYGSRGFAQAWNPRTGTYAQTRQGSKIYGTSYVQRDDNWAQTAHATNFAALADFGVVVSDEGKENK